MSNNGKRVAWVTGGGSGIGESGAEFLAADGWTVVISGRRKEELERVVANIIKKGGNYGWRRMEGDKCFDYVNPNAHPASCDKNGLTDPILVYNNCTVVPQGCFGISVTGGYVYRGSHAPWAGKYIFGDWSKGFDAMDGQIFVASKGADGKWTLDKATVPGMSTLPYMLAFAQDDKGDVFALTSISTGPVGGHDKIYRIVPAD